MRLLLAEDEKDLSDGLVEILKKNKYSVDAVYNGEDAIDYLDADNYDVAILDIMMPKVNGIEVLKSIRANGNKIPVLILTAKSEIEDKIAGLDFGADDYLTKPFSSKELLARIRAITRRKFDDNTDNIIFFGNLKLDKLNYEISCHENSYVLSNKEYQMIEILINNKEHYISADTFFSKIWGYNAEADISVVWVNISNLRKKFRNLNVNIIIKAKRGVGYKLEVTL